MRNIPRSKTCKTLHGVSNMFLVNDNVPKFLIDTYRTSIDEDAAVGTSFLQVQSVDPDEGLNGMVDYFLNDSDPFVRMDYFRLDRTSGLLQINKALDRETIPRCTLVEEN